MKQDMKKDMILQSIAKRLVRNGRTQVLPWTNSSALTYGLRAVLLLGLTLAGGSALADDDPSSTPPTTTTTGVVVNGSVYGGGNLADVKGNTKVIILAQSTGTGDNIVWTSVEGTATIKGNVFGGGKGVADNFTCDKAMVGTVDDADETKGNTSVIIGNGTVGTLNTSGALEDGTGNVYGGGEVGRVEHDTKVLIGLANGTSAPDIKGSVFGAGAGLETHGYSALVRGNTTVTIEGHARIGENVYGGGETATVGKYWVKGVDYPTTLNPPPAPPNLPVDMPYAWRSGGTCIVTIRGNAQIGPNTSTSDNVGHVFGACKGVVPHFDKTNTDSTKLSRRMKDDNTYEYFDDEADYMTFLETLALATRPIVTISGEVKIKGSVYGGGERGITRGSVDVNMLGGTVNKDIYGGGALADTNIDNWDAHADVYDKVTVAANTSVVGYYTKSGETYTAATGNAVDGTDYYSHRTGGWAENKTSASNTTNVYLLGGTVDGDVYGGGLGEKNHVDSKTADNPAYVDGDVRIYLNGLMTTEDATLITKFNTPTAILSQVTDQVNDYYHVTTGGCVVKGSVFGCNNLCGTPRGKVKVHVFKTNGDGQTHKRSTDKKGGSYELTAVYGGGNMAAYEPSDAFSTTATVQALAYPEVIIDGCNNTSIYQVYGGGNAASTPATNVTVYGTYEIGDVFGGGNGADDVEIDGDPHTENPGANVGFKEYGASWETYTLPYSTKEQRMANYGYGSGKAQVNIYGGTIHAIYGGSNTKGNVREVAVAMLEETKTAGTAPQAYCDLIVDEAYGGGKSAPMDGKAELELGCIPGIKEVYGGSRNADVNNDVKLRITNGKYDKVYGGNNEGGCINGSITVEVEEVGCTQIIIGQLFGGGNRARYSVYGYKSTTTGGVTTWSPRTKAEFETVYTSEADRTANKYADPLVNVISATSIGQVYGGGDNALVIGNTQVKIDMEEGVLFSNDTDETNNQKQPLGKVAQVYGGGNNADVDGSTHVNIIKGQIAKVLKKAATETTEEEYYMPGVYGGCNTQGTVTDSARVNVLGGTIGEGSELTATTLERTVKANVHGGGYGANTYVKGSVEVNIGSKTLKSGSSTQYNYVGTAVIYGDVYGGGALGHVNGTKNTSTATGALPITPTASTTTTVNLNKGTIYGDAYGGGLGDASNAAYVGGDVYVYQDSVAYIIDYYADDTDTADDDESTIVKSGRIFGCNNLNGYPLGDVTVTVNNTVAGNRQRTDEDPDNTGRPLMGAASLPANRRYEVAAVYGGGNLADYLASGKVSKVRLTTCYISVEEVYGGGNAAKVPATDVLILGAYEIENVFGGGNGEDKYQLNGTWHTNPGADVNGNATTLMKGGYIHQAYGASNSKGNISGTVYIDKRPGGCDDDVCPVQVDKMVAAGNNADVNGDVKVFVGCQGSDITPMVFYGADNANVNGNVEVTITSGHFGKVFAGNNIGGAIRGHIILNIEETSDCEPIRIDELYLGGYQASYSVYGYYVETDKTKDGGTGRSNPANESVELDANNRMIFLPRKSADDPHYPVDTYNRETKEWTVITDPENYPLYDQPVLNVISCTEIKEVFGGGYGVGGDMYASPTVNINMIPGSKASGVPTVMTANGLNTSDNSSKLGIIGTVYGGGNAADVIGNTTINIGTADSVNVKSWHFDGDKTYTAEDRLVEGAYITGNVYGGGKLANVGKYNVNRDSVEMTGNTFVNICAKYENGKYVAVPQGSAGVLITDSVFGGGKGATTSFKCEKAMVTGDTHINIGNGTVNGNIYGGGEVGRVEWNTALTIGLDEGTSSSTSAPVIRGNVFGAGKGVNTHGYAALVRGNSNVTVQKGSTIGLSVYGGGEIASVGKYNIADSAYAATHSGIEAGMPYSLVSDNRGICTVIVKDDVEIGPDNMKMFHTDKTAAADKPDDAGHVFGGGKGILPYVDMSASGPGRIGPNGQWESYATDTTGYFNFIKTLGLVTKTNVTIGEENSTESPFIKGSVYGGSENGLIQHDTWVYIKSGQIGCGKNTTSKHLDTVWGDGYTPPETEDLECHSWIYGLDTNNDRVKDVFAPYDPNASTTEGHEEEYSTGASTAGGRKIAYDGHTYYGNVFGGGSGSVPYLQDGVSKYISSAGSVEGSTHVIISGGHILTSVYGGCESTNVRDTAYVTMTGGTIGVPRTDSLILAHPVTCNLFGAGKGDQRIYFNKETNVNDAVVEVSGGRIYGSVFGGGEDGHILRNSVVTIGGTAKIGMKGTSYMDGNVFGGGRGFGGEALTAGNVGGAVTLNVTGGSILGSVYGGGRLASVGYGLYLVDDEVNGVKPYGTMRPDDEYDGSYTNPSTLPASQFFDKGRGKITINISNGTIGNDVADADYGGNVFGGSMGSLTKQNGEANTQWDKFATAKSTTVNVTGGTIKRSVYGGGEMGTVTEDATVKVSGGTIGKADGGGVEFGNVYGGGKGYVDPAGINYIEAGIIKGNTSVTIEAGTGTPPTIYHNIYGGGAYGSVGTFTYDTNNVITGHTANTGSTTVTITGGNIGRNGDENGMIFGSSRGDVGAPGSIHDKLAWVADAHVIIGKSGSGTDLTKPHIVGSVYGSGENGHTFNDAKVTLHSGTIGISSGETIGSYSGAAYPYRGNLYGGGCGTDKYDSNNDGTKDSYNALAGVVYGDTQVTIDGGQVVRNVYGAGAMGSVGKTNASGAIIQDGTTSITISGGKIGVDGTKGDGNVYGAARGDFTNTQTHLSQVRSTNVSMSNGTVWGNLYGGGEAGDVGTYTNTYTATGSKNYVWDAIDGTEIGDCTIEITGGTVKGDVYGAGKGEANTFECEKAMVRATSVSVSAGTVNGNVYGGGEVGRVDMNAVVTIGSGSGTEGGDAAPLIVGSVFGAGAGKETHGYSALVRGNTEVTVEGNAKVQKSVFGGGEIAAVGRYGLDAAGMPSTLVSGGECKVIVRGYAEIGPDNGGGVFGAGEGVVPHYVKDDPVDSKRSRRMDNNGDWEYFDTEAKYMNFLQTLALATDTKLSVGGNAKVYGSVYGGSKSGFVQRYTNVTIQDDCKILPTTGTDDGNVFGGGKGLTGNDVAGRVRGDVMVSILGGTTSGTVYGGAALAKSNAFVDNGVPTTTVNLFGGTIEGDVFGGGLGNATTKADVGNTQVNLNGMTTEELNALSDATLKTQLTTILTGIKEYTRKGCVVKGNVFGANNVNGTPKGHVLVHVHGTQNKDKDMNTIKDKIEVGSANVNNQNSYDVIGVFGGGKQSDYLPDNTDAKQSTEVIIEGCDLTSIYEVYGGGYGAAVPATDVLIKGTKIINNVFGGGYGDGTGNPGANIGFYTNSNNATDYPSATGKAIVQLMAGTINHVYGGSNTKGDIRGGSSVTSVERGAGAAGTGEACCDKMTILDIFGGGKSAPMFGGAEIVLGCMPNDWIGAIYGGAEAADVYNDVSLTLTSGKFGRVFGGNKSSGVIDGSIEVNIEENPNCDTPIIIGELYGGGDMAPYTTPAKYFTAQYPNYQSPRVNVRAFTSIGNIFGGGFGANATVTGNPLVNINEIEGGRAYAGEEKTLEDGTKVTLYERKADGKMGVIGNVFGGGNAAPVIGQTFVNIGTATKQKMLSLQTKDASGNIIEVEKDVLGADIRGNVYGGGNNAEVSGKTNVVIGQEK